VGQDGLSDGAPVQVLESAGQASVGGVAGAGASDAPGRGYGGQGPEATVSGGASDAPADSSRGSGGRGQRPDFSQMTPEQLEKVRERMRARGLTEEQIEERIGQAAKDPPQSTDP
jgi:hypothetical protein